MPATPAILTETVAVHSDRDMDSRLRGNDNMMCIGVDLDVLDTPFGSPVSLNFSGGRHS